MPFDFAQDNGERSVVSWSRTMSFASIPDAARDIKKGKLVIVVDDPDRENEGDLICAASKATPELINFMAKYGRGLICLPVVGQQLDKLRIAPMVENNQE